MATGKTWSIAVPITKDGGTWGYITVYFREDYDALANTSTLKVTKMTGSNNIRSGNFYSAGNIKIDGATWYSWTTGNWTFGGLSGESEFTTYSGASYPSGKVINHNDDGSKTINVSVTVSSYYGSSPTWTGSGGTVTNSVSLTVIPRASSIAATDANIGAVSQITVTRKATAYTHTIAYTFGSLTGYVDADGNAVTSAVKMDTTSIGFTIPTTFYAQIPNAKTGTCTLTVTTYSGSTQISSAKTCTFTVTAAEANCTPIVSGTVVDTNEATIALTGDENVLVRYMSNALCTISTEAKNSASISKKTIAGITVTEDTHTITGIETDTVTFGTTDSRGYSNSVDVTKSFISYIKLTNNSTAERPDPTSGKVTLVIQGSCFNGNFGAVDNVVDATYSIDGGDPVAAAVTMNGNAYSVTLNLTGFDYMSSYSIEVVVSDKLMAMSRTLPIQKGIPVFDWGEDDFRFNVEVGFGSKGQTARNLMSHGTTTGDFNSIVDQGIYWMELASSTNGPGTSGVGFLEVVNGFTLASSGVLQRFTYYDTLDTYIRTYMNSTWIDWVKINSSALDAYPIGAIYMSMDPTSPAELFGGTWTQLTDRFLVGAGNVYAVGATGGSSSITLTKANLPGESIIFSNSATSSGWSVGIWDTNGSSSWYAMPKSQTSSTTVSSFNNRPPYLAVYIWQRTA